MQRLCAIVAVLSLGLLGSGCTNLGAFQGHISESVAKPDPGLLPPTTGTLTEANLKLHYLPPPPSPIAVAVYGYQDQTGQFKPVDNIQTLSRAVTQGATSVLLKALQDASDGRWFTVVERERLDNLLKERRIIADMRQRYLGETQVNPSALPPLLFAGILLDGGIIGYDSNTKTGGLGAKYFGIGGDVQYREDTVTVYLRATSVKTGQVLLSVVAHKTILSYGLQGSVFRFVTFNRLLEAEGGFTINEPIQLAVQQSIEKAVLTLIVEGAARGLWSFSDKAYQAKIIDDYDLSYLVSANEAAHVPGSGAGPSATALAANAAQKPVPENAAASAKPPVPTWQGRIQAQAAVPPARGASAQAQTNIPINGAQPIASAPAQNVPPPTINPQQRSADASAANTTVQPKIVIQQRTLEDEVGINPR